MGWVIDAPVENNPWLPISWLKWDLSGGMPNNQLRGDVEKSAITWETGASRPDSAVKKNFYVKKRKHFTEHRLKVGGINPLWSRGVIACWAGWYGAEMLGVAPQGTVSHHHWTNIIVESNSNPKGWLESIIKCFEKACIWEQSAKLQCRGAARTGSIPAPNNGIPME